MADIIATIIAAIIVIILICLLILLYILPYIISPIKTKKRLLLNIFLNFTYIFWFIFLFEALWQRFKIYKYKDKIETINISNNIQIENIENKQSNIKIAQNYTKNERYVRNEKNNDNILSESTEKLDIIKLNQTEPLKFLSNHQIAFYPNYDSNTLYFLFEKMFARIEENTNKKYSLLPLNSDWEFQEGDGLEEQNLLSLDELHEFHKFCNFDEITEFINGNKSGLKNKNEYYVNSKNELCSTENFVIDYLINEGYKVIYAENSFWNSLTFLSFCDEFFLEGWNGFAPIPQGINIKNHLKYYQEIFDNKMELIKNTDLKKFILEQIDCFGFLKTNLLRVNIGDKSYDYVEYLKKNIYFIEYIPNEIFLLIINHIVSNMSKNQRGLPDLLAYKDNNLYFIEVKRKNEKIREAQTDWLNFLRQKNLNIKIIRVK